VHSFTGSADDVLSFINLGFISASMDGKCIVDMTIFIASAKEVMFLPEFVCLSVC